MKHPSITISATPVNTEPKSYDSFAYPEGWVTVLVGIEYQTVYSATVKEDFVPGEIRDGVDHAIRLLPKLTPKPEGGWPEPEPEPVALDLPDEPDTAPDAAA